MRGAIYKGVGQVEVVDLPTPEAGPKDVVVKVVTSGICGTDVAEFHVRNSGAVQPGQPFGHELSGFISQVGSEVEGIAEGLRVTVNPITATHGGRRQSCMLGAFSEYILVQDAQIGVNLFPLSENMTYEDGALIEPFSVGQHGVNLAQPKVDDVALVLGAGAIGLSALAGMKAMGIKNVVISDVSEFRLEKARQLGASLTHNPKEQPLDEFLLKHFPVPDPRMGVLDVVVDGAGVGVALEGALALTTRHARVSIIALHKAPISIHPMLIMSKELKIQGSAGYIDEFSQVMDFRSTGKADLRPIITHRFPLEDIGAALDMSARVDEAVKVLVDMPA